MSEDVTPFIDASDNARTRKQDVVKPPTWCGRQLSLGHWGDDVSVPVASRNPPAGRETNAASRRPRHSQNEMKIIGSLITTPSGVRLQNTLDTFTRPRTPSHVVRSHSHSIWLGVFPLSSHRNVAVPFHCTEPLTVGPLCKVRYCKLLIMIQYPHKKVEQNYHRTHTK